MKLGKVYYVTCVTPDINWLPTKITLHCTYIFIEGPIEYSLRESLSAQGREGRGFDSDPGRNLKKRGYILSRDSEVYLLSHHAPHRFVNQS
jgi:hypothetical protein